MGVKVNNTNKTFDEYNFDNFFNVSNLYNFDRVYVTKKDIFSDGLSIGKDITLDSTNYSALMKVSKATLLVIDDFNVVSKLQLEDVIGKFSGVIVFRNAHDLVKMNLIKTSNIYGECEIDKYGNVKKL
ncbi:MAG: hypothetical protein Q4C44_04175 [bacterium]|nr:hypothetical protein [bacterium]